MAWEVPSLNYSNILFDGSSLAGLGDDIAGGLRERGAKSALTKYANSLYGTDQPEQGSLGARLLRLGQQTPNDPVNDRINQGFDVAGEQPGGYAADLGLAPEQYRSAYADAGQKYGVDPTLLVRQGKQESGFDANAVSKAGARGISQFMPATAEQYGVDPSNAEQSIDAQGHMMADVTKEFGNPGLGLMAYNWGSGNVKKWLDSGADPANVPRETQDYVERVSGKPVEAWLGGGQPQIQPEAQQQSQQPTVSPQEALAALPSREILSALLRNPLTREFGASLVQNARMGILSPYDFERVGNSLVRVDKRTGEATPVFQGQPTQTNGNPPSYRQGANGNLEFVPGGPADPSVIGAQQKARTGGHAPRPLPLNALNALGTAGSAYADLDRVSGTFEDSFGGYKSSALGAAANTATRYGIDFGYGNVPGAEWWQDYQRQKNVTRHDLFGSALTKTELPQFEAADINPGMTPETIKKNLGRQRMIAERAAKKLAGAYVAQGYQPDVIEQALGISLSELGINVPQDTQAPPDQSQQPVDLVPPGVDPGDWEYLTPEERQQYLDAQ